MLLLCLFLHLFVADVYMCCSMCVEVRGNLWESFFPFYYVGPSDQTQAGSLFTCCIILLAHLFVFDSLLQYSPGLIGIWANPLASRVQRWQVCATTRSHYSFLKKTLDCQKKGEQQEVFSYIHDSVAFYWIWRSGRVKTRGVDFLVSGGACIQWFASCFPKEVGSWCH